MGANGDEFEISAGGAFPAFRSSPGNPTTITFSDLDFSEGEILVGIAELTSVFANTSFTFSDDSVTFSFDDGPGDPGIILQGRFLTTPATIPLPAASVLLLTGLGGLAAFRRK